MAVRSCAHSTPSQQMSAAITRKICGVACGTIAMTVGLSGHAISDGALSNSAIAQTNTAETNTAQSNTPQTDPAQISILQSGETTAITPPDAPTPSPTPFSPDVRGILDLTNGAESIQSLGQLRPRNVEAFAADDVDWLSDVVLPLYVSPGGEHWGWIYQGWIIPQGQTYLAIGRDASLAMVRAYENLYTFPVLEAREDGWFRVQYSPGGSAWAHASHLELGDVELAVEGWEEILRSQPSVYFLETGKAQPLRSEPKAATNMLGMVPSNSLIEPLAFQGDWMQVRVTRPASACRALAGATVTEGWMRWRGEERESLVWYRPGQTCS